MSKLEDLGHIFVTNEIDAGEAVKIIEKITDINMLPEHEKPRKIFIQLCSPGGQIKAGTMILSAMEGSRIPITTVALGEIASLATIIFMAGNERLVHEDSILMCHQWSCGAYGTSSDLKSKNRQFELIDATFKKWLKRYSNASKEDLETKLFAQTDYYFGAQEAIELGIADKIFTELPIF